jgi:hypothetical protein
MLRASSLLRQALLRRPARGLPGVTPSRPASASAASQTPPSTAPAAAAASVLGGKALVALVARLRKDTQCTIPQARRALTEAAAAGAPSADDVYAEACRRLREEAALDAGKMGGWPPLHA